MNRKIMPTTYFLIILLLSIASYFVLPIVKFIHFPLNLIGIVPLIFGIVLNLRADAMFKKDETTVKPYLKPTALQDKGPFAISRHPMYLGMFSILLGTAILLGVVSAFILSIVYVGLMEWIFMPTEEKNLQEAFGEQYLEYRKRVRRWI
jgi:protein-S-isoprenylcysteine O-methyltransferase Ste14